MYQVTFYNEEHGNIESVVPAETFDDGVACVVNGLGHKPGLTVEADALGNGTFSLRILAGEMTLAVVADAPVAEPAASVTGVVEACDALAQGGARLIKGLFLDAMRTDEPLHHATYVRIAQMARVEQMVLLETVGVDTAVSDDQSQMQVAQNQLADYCFKNSLTLVTQSAWRQDGSTLSCDVAFRNDQLQAREEVFSAEMFKPNTKVYFGRGPMEFVGVVLSAEAGKVIISGVETGCLSLRRATVEVERLENLRVIDDAEFIEHTLNEPAFADTMTKDRYLQLQSELEGLELSLAKGEETDATDFRIREIELLMEHSPWTLDPDDGCIPKAIKPHGASRPGM